MYDCNCVFHLFLLFSISGNMGACHNLSVMYRKGDGVAQDLEMANKLMHKAQDIHDQMTKERDRLKFQEGVETAGGGAPLKF